MLFTLHSADIHTQTHTSTQPASIHISTPHTSRKTLTHIHPYDVVVVFIRCVCVSACQRSQTPLHISSEEGHLAVTTLLLDRGADVNRKDFVSDAHAPTYAHPHTHSHTPTYTCFTHEVKSTSTHTSTGTHLRDDIFRYIFRTSLVGIIRKHTHTHTQCFPSSPCRIL